MPVHCLICSSPRQLEGLERIWGPHVTIHATEAFLLLSPTLFLGAFWPRKRTVPEAVADCFGRKIVGATTPALCPKARKNEAEINDLSAAHLRDGRLGRVLAWC